MADGLARSGNTVTNAVGGLLTYNAAPALRQTTSRAALAFVLEHAEQHAPGFFGTADAQLANRLHQVKKSLRMHFVLEDFAVLVRRSGSPPRARFRRGCPCHYHQYALGAEALHDAHLDADEVRVEHPISVFGALAGLVSGPRMLKMVRTPFRVAAPGRRCFIAGWWLGANMKPMPVASMLSDLFRRQVDVGTQRLQHVGTRSWTTRCARRAWRPLRLRPQQRRSRSWRC